MFQSTRRPRLICTVIILAICGCSAQRIDEEVQSTPLTVSTASNAVTTALPSTSPTHAVQAAPTPRQTPPKSTLTVSEIVPTPSPTMSSSTAPSVLNRSLDGTLLLYTTYTDNGYRAFKTWPTLTFLDPAVFDVLYGERQYADDMSLFFLDFTPKLSPNSRYVLVPGLASYPIGSIKGTGTWLIDLELGEARQLLPDGRFATWNPASDAIAYVEDATLYTLSIAEEAEPQPIFQHSDLWTQYAHWSPDGQWIAALTSSREGTDEYETGYAATYWLVPPDGGPARELTTQDAGAIEYCSCDMSWSPDGQYLLVRNRVFDLTGQLLSPDADYAGRVNWLPYDSQLLMNSAEGLSIITIAGEEADRISDSGAGAWDFSHDGRRLAYTQSTEEGLRRLVVYDLHENKAQTIQPVTGAPLRWSTDDSHLLMSVYRDNRVQIVAISLESNGEEVALVDEGLLIEVVPYVPPP